ncbi:hypothetical protein ABK040_015857 [Willaertia magna]
MTILLSTLHNDVLFQILFYLTPFEISKLQLINKHWHLNCKDNILWKYFYNYYFKQFDLKNIENVTKENDDFYWYNKFINFVKYLPKYLPNKSKELSEKERPFYEEKDQEGYYDYHCKFFNIYVFKIFNNFNQNDNLQNLMKLMKLSLFFSILMYEGDYKLNTLQDLINIYCNYYSDDENNSQEMKETNNETYERENSQEETDENNEVDNNNEENDEYYDDDYEYSNYKEIVPKICKQMPILSFCKLFLDYNYCDIFNLLCQSNQMTTKIKLMPNNLENTKSLNDPQNYKRTIGISPNVNFNGRKSIVNNEEEDVENDNNDSNDNEYNNNNGDEDCIYEVTLMDSKDYIDRWCPIYWNASAYWRHKARFNIEFNVREKEIVVKAESYSLFG